MTTAVFCNRCGHRNPVDSNFCSSCGAPLDPSVGRDDRTITFSLPDLGQESASPDDDVVVHLGELPAAGVLIVRAGPEAGEQVVLDRAITEVGRHPDSAVFLDDVTVSRRHAEFHRVTDGTYEVLDVGSLNGTYVNRERVERAVLRSGDEVQIGKFRLVFLEGVEA